MMCSSTPTARRLGSLLTGIALALLCPPVHAQLDVLERGFRVKTLPSGTGAKGVECSPGGIWGEYVYVGDSSGSAIERIDLSDNVSLFASGSMVFPVGMEFGPGPGGTFGDFLYVCDFALNAILKVDTNGTITPFTGAPGATGAAFDPTGAFGTDLFVAAGVGGARPILKMNSMGVPILFTTAVVSNYLDFGPGGVWGQDLYATDLNFGGHSIVDSTGVATGLTTGFSNPEGFDWAAGPRFDGDLFATDNIAGEIRRVVPGGTHTLWATLPQAADVAYCSGSLFVVSGAGECYKVGGCAAFSPFDADLEGWFEVDPVEAGATWQSSGGNPDGYLELSDLGSGEARVLAPPGYDSDWRELDEIGFLTFDAVVLDDGGQAITGVPTISLFGPCGSAEYAFASSPTTSWTAFDVELDESLWTVTSGTWAELLGNIGWVELGLDFTDSQSDVSGVDNFCLGPLEPRAVLYSGSPFCDDSDGSLAWCPCANPGDADTGCEIPQATGGVKLQLVQVSTSPPNRATVQGSGFSPTSNPSAIVIRAAELDPETPVVFGDGLRCVGVPLVRLSATAAVGGVSTHTFGHGAMAGCGTFYYQLWFRSQPIMYCDPTAAFNLSNGLALAWPPMVVKE